MRIAITGSNGQLGMDLVGVLREKNDVYPFDIDLDILNLKAFTEKMEEIKPTLIIHTAAFTNVDLCEKERDEAFTVNAIGTQNVALASRKCGAAMLYVSTDYIFDGEKGSPYTEFDEARPLNHYGWTKLAGEYYCKMLLREIFVVRTSWLYGRAGHNFVSTILKKAKMGERIEVVNDQTGSPTFSLDLARNIERLIESGRFGIYHLSGNGECSWFEFARKIVELARIRANIVPISSDQIGRAAVRPRYSVLRNMCVELAIGDKMPRWEDSLERYIVEREVETA